MSLPKLTIAALGLATLVAPARAVTPAVSSPASLEATVLPQDPGSFFGRLQQLRQRRASFDQPVVPNPEPVTLSLLGLGGLGLAFSRRRKSTKTRPQD